MATLRRAFSNTWILAETKRFSHLTSSDIVKFRDTLLERVSSVTANEYIKVLRLALQDALREHLVSDNPAKLELVGSVKRKKFGSGYRIQKADASTPVWPVLPSSNLLSVPRAK
jgi:hypothetical protein